MINQENTKFNRIVKSSVDLANTVAIKKIQEEL